MSRYWVFTSNPTHYHWDTLFAKGGELWDSTDSGSAQRYLKQIRKGDRVLCHHGPPACCFYGVALVASDPYETTRQQGRIQVVSLRAVLRLPRPVPVKEFKLNRAFRRVKYVARTHLPISPLREDEYKEILHLAGRQ